MAEQKPRGTYITRLVLTVLVLVMIAKIVGVIDWSWWIILGIFGFYILLQILLWLVFDVKASSKKEILAETIDEMVSQFRNYEGEQQSLRSLRFWQPPGSILSYPADEVVSISSPSPPFIYINLSVNWTQSEEDNSPLGMQRFAEKHSSSLGGTLLRNEIREVAGMNAVDLEYTTPVGMHTRKLVFMRHCSEYAITIGAPNTSTFKQMVPVIDAFLETLSIHKPDLTSQQALGGRLMIGIPEGWNQLEDTAEVAVWEGSTPVSRTWLRLRPMNVAQRTDFVPDIFASFEDSLFQRELPTVPRYLAETGASILMRALSQSKRVREDDSHLVQEQIYSYAFGIRLATGLHLLLDFDHKGSEHDIFPGALRWQSFAMEVIATIEDRAVS